MINRSITGIVTCSCVWFSLNFDLNSSNGMSENLIELQNKNGFEVSNFRPKVSHIVELHPKNNNRNVGQKILLNGGKKRNCLCWLIPTIVVVGGGLAGTLTYFLTRNKSTDDQYNNCNNLCFSEKEKKRIIEELSKNGIKENVDFSFCPENNKDFYVFNLSRNVTKDDVKKYYSNNYEYSEQINFATDFDDLICNIAIKDPQKFFSNEVVKQWLSNNIIGLECTKSGTIKQDNFSELFKNYSSLYYVDISKINLSDVLSMEDMFYGCSNLTDLAADWGNTINCTDMSGLFYNCSSLKNITSFTEEVNVTNVEKVDYLFSGCSNLEYINCSNWNLSSINSMSHLFDNCSNLQTITLPKVGNNLTDASFLFSDCKNLTGIHLLEDFNPINVTNVSHMFYGCSSLSKLNLSNFIGNKIKNIDNMFAECSNLTTINAPKFSPMEVETFEHIFLGNSNLTKVCCQQSEYLNHFLSELWESSPYYSDGCYQKINDQCSDSGLKTEIEEKFNLLGLRKNLDYFFQDLSDKDNNNEFIVMQLNNGCFLSVKNLYINVRSILSDLEHLYDIKFIKGNGNINTLNRIFLNCRNIKNVDLTNIDMSIVSDVDYMFDDCSFTTKITIIGFNVPQSASSLFNNIFYRCTNLEEVCTFSENSCIEESLRNLWDKNTVYIKNCYIREPEGFCKNNTIKEELNNKFRDLQLIEGDDYVWYNNSENANFYVIKFNNEDCYLSIKDIYFGGQSIFSSLENIMSVEIVKSKENAVLTTAESMFENCQNLKTVNFGGIDFSNIVSAKSMFRNCSKLEGINLESLNSNNIESFESMFENCEELININLNTIKTQKSKSFKQMFKGCKQLNSLNLSSFNTGLAEDMSGMFDGCSKITSLDLTNFNVGNVVDMSFMFVGCSELSTLELWTNSNTDNLLYIQYMFASLEKLEYIDLEKITTSKVVNMDSVFSNCKNLQYLNLVYFESTALTTAKKMFENCVQLRHIDSPDFSPSLEVDTEDIFKNCRSLMQICMYMNENMLNHLSSIFSRVDYLLGNNCYYVSDYRDETDTVSPSVIANMQSFNLLSKELSRHYIKTIPQNIYGNKTFGYLPVSTNSIFNNTTLSLK